MKRPLFEKFAEDYACSRPGYPAEIRPFLFDRFSINSDSILVDIACGPGMFTQLLACGHDSALVTGVDRSLPLLNAGIRYYRNFRFEAVCGCGELLPIKSESCDMITVAQAFHWMHQKRSLSEIVRTLKHGGGLSIISYRRKDLKEPHQAFIENLTYQFNPNYDPAFMDINYVEMLLGDGRFREIGQKRFYSSQNYSLEKYLRWQRSKSYIGDAMEPDILDDFLNQVESGMRQFFPDGTITEEFKFDVIWARKS
jgi:ubiquinone/menaquinone biosynthesis C-methylase UbiE